MIVKLITGRKLEVKLQFLLLVPYLSAELVHPLTLRKLYSHKTT